VARRKRCPKCGGSVLLNKDFYGWYEECLQCGHMHVLKVIATVRRPRVMPKGKGKRPMA
jgi:ribosomal protein S27AE